MAISRAALLVVLAVVSSSEAGAEPKPCRASVGETWSGSLKYPEALIQHGQLGTFEKPHGAWGAAKITLSGQLTTLREQLWNPATIKNPKNTTFTTRDVPAGEGLLREAMVQVRLKPVFFITLNWLEQWRLRELSPDKHYRIDYQKVSGDERFKHFCGWIELKQTAQNLVEATAYEEADTPHRKPEEVSRGMLETLLRAAGKISRQER